MGKGTYRGVRTAPAKIGVELIRRYYDHDVGRDSAALTYYLLFAIFPLLIFVSTLLGALDLDIDNTLAVLGELIPVDALGIVRTYLEYVAGNSSRQLMWFSLVFSVWFPMRATGCLMHSLRKAFGQSRPETMIRGQIRTLLFTILLIVTIAASMVLTVVGRRALEFVSTLITLPAGFINSWNHLRFLVLGVVMFVVLSLLYMLAQGQRRPLREVAPGVMSSLVGWMILSLAFSYYVEKRAHYSELYGSIAAIVVTLLWLYMTGVVLIMGAELSGVLLARKKDKSVGTTADTETKEEKL